MNTTTLMVEPVIQSERTAPISARGIVNIMTNGCSRDSNCAVAGCNSELCLEKSLAEETSTICEWKEEYDCYKLSECGCVNGKCAWKANDKFLECLDKYA